MVDQIVNIENETETQKKWLFGKERNWEKLKVWWLNPRQGDEGTCPRDRKISKALCLRGFMVVATGLEPVTPSMWTMCSTNWAMRPYSELFSLINWNRSVISASCACRSCLPVGRSLEILMNRQFDNLTSGFYQLSHATLLIHATFLKRYQ